MRSEDFLKMLNKMRGRIRENFAALFGVRLNAMVRLLRYKPKLRLSSPYVSNQLDQQDQNLASKWFLELVQDLPLQ